MGSISASRLFVIRCVEIRISADVIVQYVPAEQRSRLANITPMPRTPTIYQDEFPYSVTARSNNKEWFDLPLEVCWPIFCEVLSEVADQYKFMSHAFLLMSNHYHWLLTTPLANLGEGMRYFQTETSRKMGRAAGRINKIYGARYKPCLIHSPVYYANSYRYIFQNPLRAGMVKQVEDYSWSTLVRPGDVPLTSSLIHGDYIPPEERELLPWLNQVPEAKYNECIRRALLHSKFKFPRDPKSKCKITGLEFL